MGRHSVLHDPSGPEEGLFHDALILGLSRIAVQLGRGTLADRSKRTTRSLDMLFAGETGIPNAKGFCDFLLADATALDEVLALYGVKVCARQAKADADMATASQMAAAVAELIAALEDGRRNHNETIRVAKHLRPLLPKLTAIVAEADEILA